MNKKDFFKYCLDAFGTLPDCPFNDDNETSVFRHNDTRKWYAIVMRVSRRKLGIESNESVDIVNLKLPSEMFGFFTSEPFVYPAYHMNKQHWISVPLADAPSDTLKYLTRVSFEATKSAKKNK